MKQALTLLVLALGGSVLAQAVPVVTLRDTNGNVVNGTTVIVYGAPTDTMELDLSTQLTANVTDSLSINVRRRELNQVAGSKNTFCWGLCYLYRNSGQTPLWVSQDPIEMGPQQTVTNFHAYYRPLGNAAYACFQYVWYDESTNDSAWVNICFDTETFTGVQEQVALEPTLAAYPNPVAGGDVTFTYDAAGGVGGMQLVLYNALGERAVVRSLSSSNGRATVSTGTLTPGIWFAALEQNGRMVATRRLVVGR
jgi:hypothetical protein